jgi:hypothetical protein
MNFQGTIAAAAFVLGLAPAAMWGQAKEQVCNNSVPDPKSGSCYIDNFKTGRVTMKGSLTETTTTTQTGDGILGGNRAIQMIPDYFGLNTFSQPAQVQVLPSGSASVPSALLLSNGYSAFPGVWVFYGAANDGTPPLNFDLVPYNQLQLSFAGLSNGLDLIIEADDPNGAYGAVSCGVSSQGGGAFTINVPLANFNNPSLDWSNISSILVGFFAGNIYGTPNLAVTGFSAILPTNTTGTVTCGPPAS